MFAGRKNADSGIKNKKTVIGKNKTKKQQAKMGNVSCVCAAAAFGLLALAVAISFLEIGKAGALIGGMGASSIVLALMGIKASARGRREREKSHLTCWIGVVLNILLLVGLIIIYII